MSYLLFRPSVRLTVSLLHPTHYSTKSDHRSNTLQLETSSSSPSNFLASQKIFSRIPEAVSLGLTIPFGSRFENYTEKGLSHILKAMTYKSNKNITQMAITRTAENLACPLQTFLGREGLTFYAEGPSSSLEFMSRALSESLETLNDYMKHEFISLLEKVHFESFAAYKRAEYRLIETLHQIAFKSQLGNPLLALDWRLHGISLQDIINFKARIAAKNDFRYSLIGLGLDAEKLRELDASYFGPAFQNLKSSASEKPITEQPLSTSSLETQYFGGEEIIETSSESLHLAVAFPTVGFAHTMYPQHMVLQALLTGLGDATALMPYSRPPGLLSAAYYKAKSEGNISGQFSPIALTYSDAGLLGFRVSASSNEALFKDGLSVMEGLLEAVNNLTEDMVSRAKSMAKFAFSRGLDSRVGFLDYASQQLLFKQSGNLSAQVVLSAIDSVTTAAVKKSLSKMLGANPSVIILGSHLKNESFLSAVVAKHKSSSSNTKKDA